MATAFRSASFKTGTAAGSGAVTEPAGTASGDVLVALTAVDAGASSLARPAGWTNLLNDTTGAGGFDYDVSYIVRGGSAPSLTWSWTTSGYYEIQLLCFSGVDTSTPIDAQSTPVTSTTALYGTTQAASDIDPGPMTVATANAMALALAVHWQGSPAGGWSAPTNYTLRSDNTVGNDTMAATRQLTATGTEDPNEFFTTGGTGNGHMLAYAIALKEAGAGGGDLSVSFGTIGEPVTGGSTF